MAYFMIFGSIFASFMFKWKGVEGSLTSHTYLYDHPLYLLILSHIQVKYAILNSH